MKIDISSTADEGEKRDKVLQIEEMLKDFKTVDVQFNTVQQVESLTIYQGQSRGRPRGRKNRVIGLPAGSRSTRERMIKFEELSEAQQNIYLLQLILIDKKSVDKVIVDKIKITTTDLNHLELKNIPDALGSESVKIQSIQSYFDSSAFKYLNKLIKEKIKKGYWTCNACKIALNNEIVTIECGRCLFWSHITCVFVENEDNDWFCSNCERNYE